MQRESSAGYLTRAPRSSGLADVLEILLDRGLVIDAYVRVSLVGIELITVAARVVIASIDTYLKYAEADGITPTVARPALGPGGGFESGGTAGSPTSTPSGAARGR